MAQNRYKKLMGNTIIFAIGTFSSKVLVFLMLPFYTNILSTGEYGTVDALINVGQLMIPIASVGINNAVIRFGLENDSDKKSVFSSGLYTILIGFICLAVVSPILRLCMDFMAGYTIAVLAFVLASSLRTLCIQFALSMGYNKMYAANGIGNTFLNVILNILLLPHFRVMGYLMANIISDLVLGLVMFMLAKEYNYFLPPFSKRMDRKLSKRMRQYALPLVPQTVCQWIINMSDRYLIIWFISTEANGLYAAANKIPNILLIVANLFADAWQISAVKESDPKEQVDFFSKVLGAYSSIAFIGSSGLIMVSKFVMTFMVGKDFFISWRFIPILTLATTFGLLSTFLASVYMLKLKSKNSMVTTMICAAVNIVLNCILIRWMGKISPFYGAMGAGIATFISYLVLFLIRAFNTQKYLKIRWNIQKTVLSIVILFTQALIMTIQAPLWYIFVPALFVILFIINAREILLSVNRLLRRG
ncbi:MAG: polysaccharide biosynthesis C-terminal domain-containing protein [Eubacteriales bacterium]|nr:polysaccharide biosynthesis C-terminal domain-containing protein [Eubacteriales bacterium]